MKKIQKCSLTSTTKLIHLLSSKLALTLVALGLLAVAPIAVQAGGVTQLAFLQTLAQVTGDGGQFGPGSTAQDYIQWAQAKGMTPAGGWNASATLSKDQLAQLVVQLLNLNPKKGGGDYIRILQREGIDLSGDDSQVTPKSLASLFGSPFLPRVPSGSPAKGNNGVGNGEDPPPPGFLNPKNPHYGGGQNDGPGTSPGNPNPHNKP
jgi:hypothetical protein